MNDLAALITRNFFSRHVMWREVCFQDHNNTECEITRIHIGTSKLQASRAPKRPVHAPYVP